VDGTRKARFVIKTVPAHGQLKIDVDRRLLSLIYRNAISNACKVRAAQRRSHSYAAALWLRGGPRSRTMWAGLPSACTTAALRSRPPATATTLLLTTPLSLTAPPPCAYPPPRMIQQARRRINIPPPLSSSPRPCRTPLPHAPHPPPSPGAVRQARRRGVDRG
jgi:hypothetical protein